MSAVCGYHGLNAHSPECLFTVIPSTAIGHRVATHGPVVITIWVGSELHGTWKGRGREEGRKVTESESSGCHLKPDPVQWRERFQAIGPLVLAIG